MVTNKAIDQKYLEDLSITCEIVVDEVILFQEFVVKIWDAL